MDIGYATTILEIPQDSSADCGGPPIGRWFSPFLTPRKIAGVLAPSRTTAGSWGLLGSHDVKPPEDEAGLLAFSQQLRTPTIYSTIKGATWRAPTSRYGLKASRWRHFERLDLVNAVKLSPIFGDLPRLSAKDTTVED